MITTDKKVCRMTASLLAEYGVKDVVLSPGSRNAPLIMAMVRSGLRCRPVVDERSAAFVALGIASISGAPVALVCTSGSAMLNYAPSVAEAYYRKLPLIVISADRPEEWIGQDDSQTIRQPGALSNITVGECDLSDSKTSADGIWFLLRSLNDTLLKATTGRRGPVHINIQLHKPLTGEQEVSEEHFRRIQLLEPLQRLATDQARNLASRMEGKRVLVVGGFHSPDASVSRALGLMASLPDVAVICEGLANVHAPGVIEAPERLLSGVTESEADALRPDLLITFGGSLVSSRLKEYLRRVSPAEHWHVGRNVATIDCFKALTARVEMPAAGFFPRLSRSLAYLSRKSASSSGYSKAWRKFSESAARTSDDFIKEAPWSDLAAISRIVEALPADVNLQLGNGMSVRYALLQNLSRLHRSDSNRGVSGIDGCLSTAAGASMAYKGTTVLIIGDMSAVYDLSAFTLLRETPGLRVIVMANGGGEIFRAVATTRNLPEREQFFACPKELPLNELAPAYGLRFYSADSFESLGSALPEFLAGEGCALLEVITDGELSAEVMHSYLKQSK